MEIKAYVKSRFNPVVYLIGEELPTGIELADPCHPYIIAYHPDEKPITGFLSISDDFWSDAYPANNFQRDDAIENAGGREEVERLLQKLVDQWMKRIDPDDLIGQTEFAEIIGWDRRKVATYYHRGVLPKPVKVLGSGPIWIREQAENFRSEINEEELK